MAQKWRLFTVVREVDDELRRAGVRDRTACNAAKKATTERPFVFNLHIVCKKAVSCQDRLGADVGKIASRKERKEGPFVAPGEGERAALVRHQPRIILDQRVFPLLLDLGIAGDTCMCEQRESIRTPIQLREEGGWRVVVVNRTLRSDGMSSEVRENTVRASREILPR
jgi:hypothetical protein